MASISRDRSPVAILLTPSIDIPRAENDIKLHDYLNDKFQATADLKSSNLSEVLTNVQKQKEQLDEQLKDVRHKLAESKKSSGGSHPSPLLEQGREFEERQIQINERLMRVTASSDPEEAIDRLKRPMEKLRRVALAKEYVELLKEVNDLTVDARQHLPDNPKEALKPYTQLKELAISLRRLQDPAEGAASHLVNYVENASAQLWANMTKIMTDEFEAILKRANWPNVAEVPTREWMDCFEKLLELQYPEMTDAREPLILLPISVLAKPFIQQFKYNFSSDKATSEPSKIGDHVFAWVLGTVKRWESFLRGNVAPILAAHFRGTALAGNSLYVDPISALVTTLLPILKEKIDTVMEPISRDPRLLSKFMSQLLLFDENIRSAFNYDGGNLQYGWKGLSWEIMDTWFDRWLQVEKTFALHRYQDIIQSPDSGRIDYDSVAPGKTKPTFGAVQVIDLLASVTDSYNKLRRFSHKVRFLIEIQAEIFDQYQGRLSESLHVYQSVTSAIGRTIHGVTKEQQAELEGIGGLQSLCKVYGSAEHVIDFLKEWSNQDFFVDLWEQLQDRARNTNTDDNLAGSMSYTVVKESTSNAVGSAGNGAVFDVTRQGFENLQKRSSEFLVQALKYNYPNILKQYIHRAQWTTVGLGDDSSPPAITPELDQPLRTMKGELEFLSKALGQADYRRICRQCFLSLQDLLWNEVLMKQDFTTLGANRFRQDILALGSVAHSGDIWNPKALMGRLDEGVTLLSLPLNNENGVSLMEAVNAIFAPAPEADQMLDKLGFRNISKLDARAILQKRREASI